MKDKPTRFEIRLAKSLTRIGHWMGILVAMIPIWKKLLCCPASQRLLIVEAAVDAVSGFEEFESQ